MNEISRYVQVRTVPHSIVAVFAVGTSSIEEFKYTPWRSGGNVHLSLADR